MKIINFSILFIVHIISYTNGFSQDGHYSIDLNYQYGYVLPTSRFLSGENKAGTPINRHQALRFKFSKQTTGASLWEELLHYPSWGLGIFRGDFFNDEEIGNPYALYGFIQGSMKRWNKLSLHYDVHVGASTNWQYFHPELNPYNNTIGNNFNIYFDVGCNFKYLINPALDATFGVSFNHFSNGMIKLPNLGINSPLANIGLNYQLTNRPEFVNNPIPEFKKYWAVDIATFGAVRNQIYRLPNKNNKRRYDSHNFFIKGIAASYNYHYSHLSSIGFGMTVYHNPLLNATVDRGGDELIVEYAEKTKDKIELSIYPSYELRLNRVSLLLQPEIYIRRQPSIIVNPLFQQKIGFKCYFTGKLYAAMILKAYSFSKANITEWHLGYHF